MSDPASDPALPYWCGGCGATRTAAKTWACAACRARPRIEDFACGVCGAPSDVMYVYGFRCRTHETVREPSQGVAGPDVAGCYGTLLRPRQLPPPEDRT